MCQCSSCVLLSGLRGAFPLVWVSGGGRRWEAPMQGGELVEKVEKGPRWRWNMQRNKMMGGSQRSWSVLHWNNISRSALKGYEWILNGAMKNQRVKVAVGYGDSQEPRSRFCALAFFVILVLLFGYHTLLHAYYCVMIAGCTHWKQGRGRAFTTRVRPQVLD